MGSRAPGSGSGFRYTFIKNVYTSHYIRPRTGESPLEVPPPSTRSPTVLKPDVANFPHSPYDEGIHLWEMGAVREWRVRVQVPGLTRLSGRSKCMRALHVRRSGRARLTT